MQKALDAIKYSRNLIPTAQPVAVDDRYDEGFDDGHTQGYQEGREEASGFDRDLRRVVFKFLEDREQIEKGEEYTAQDIFDALIYAERAALSQSPAPDTDKIVEAKGLLHEAKLKASYGNLDKAIKAIDAAIEAVKQGEK